MKVKVEGSYTNGHSYERVVEVVEPEGYPPIGAPPSPSWVTSEDAGWWHEWWWEEVFPHTGDGVRIGGIGGSHKATVVEAADPSLVGADYIFEG